MSNPFSQLMQKLSQSKPILFGLYGAMGCLLAAILLGEPLLALTKLPPSPPSVRQISQAVVLLIDTSSSMANGKLEEVKSAASSFVDRQNLSEDRLAVVNFGATIDIASPLTADRNSLKSAIANLSVDGGTPMDRGIEAAVTELKSTSLNRNILLFTDGAPDSQSLTSIAAKSAKSQQINIIAVATGGADVNYLAKLTGDRSLVFYASSGNFDLAFREAEAAIFSRQLVESGQTGDYGLVYASLRIGAWTALLAIGISLALLIGQNQYLRRRLLTIREGSLSTTGSLIAGLIAGGLGQLLFLPLTNISNSGLIGGILNWGIFGALLAGGLSFFKRKLELHYALLTGGLGGVLTAGAMLGVSHFIGLGFIGDWLSRLIGGIIFGRSIGFLAGSTMGLIAGIATAIFGQSLFFIAGISTLEVASRIVGWTILGTLVGGGISFFIPNLQLSRALIGGCVGGTLGAISFLMTAAIFGDIPGRLTGAAILGFCIGLMIAWAEKEQLRKEAYVLVHWTPTEKRSILLGTKPILLGSSYEAQIPLSKGQGFAPITAKMYKEREVIIMEYDQEYGKSKGMKKLKHELQDGDTRKLGDITLEIKTAIETQ